MNFVTDQPELYDILYHDFTDDLEMYVQYASKHDEILLCGAGTGRTTFPIAENGVKVIALDISEKMLSCLKQKMSLLPLSVQNNISIIRGDMRNFKLDSQISCCIVPFSTFNYLLTIEDQRKSLQCIKNSLKIGGELILELLSVKTFPEIFEERGEILGHIAEYDGNKIETWRTTSFDASTQTVRQLREFRFYRGNDFLKSETVEWVNRFFFLGEIRLLLEENDFIIKNVYGDYQYGSYDNNSEFIVIQAIAR